MDPDPILPNTSTTPYSPVHHPDPTLLAPTLAPTPVSRQHVYTPLSGAAAR